MQVLFLTKDILAHCARMLQMSEVSEISRDEWSNVMEDNSSRSLSQEILSHKSLEAGKDSAGSAIKLQFYLLILAFENYHC